jgi:3-hydroxymyristoyl/3-hydroxydecanoyl-(acyl carrier protein) dehydratase
MTGWNRHAIHVPESHATALGHFPGRPIVPGALLLDEVLRLLGDPGPISFRAVKFLAPVRHGEVLELRWRRDEGGLCRFEIRRGGEPASILAGTLEGLA